MSKKNPTISLIHEPEDDEDNTVIDTMEIPYPNILKDIFYNLEDQGGKHILFITEKTGNDKVEFVLECTLKHIIKNEKPAHGESTQGVLSFETN